MIKEKDKVRIRKQDNHGGGSISKKKIYPTTIYVHYLKGQWRTIILYMEKKFLYCCSKVQILNVKALFVKVPFLLVGEQAHDIC